MVAKYIAKQLELDDTIKQTGEQRAFITLKQGCPTPGSQAACGAF